MKQLFKLLVLLIFSISASNLMANPVMPLGDNAIAPDFTVTDINGNSHTLYDYLDDGKMVILDFSATWCPPCWSYHQSNVLKDIYNTYGPNGTDEIMVLFIEADASTPVSALYGTGNTQGNWVTGTPYPIVNDASLNGAYQISFFPTLYSVCSDRKIYEVGATSINGWLNRLESCGLDGSAVAEDVTCFGSNDGSIDLTSTGGHGSVSYSWNTGDSSEDIDNLTSGNYAVTISDVFNREVVVDNIFVSSSAPITITTVANQSVSCNGASDGQVSVNAAGGNSGFSYNWSNGDTGPTVSNVSAGTYTVTATDSEGCEGFQTVVVTQPAQLSAAANTQAENCGNSDGFLFVSAQGGTFPYTFDFGNGETSNPILTGIPAGTYDVTVTDLLGCSYVDSYVVAEIPAPEAIIAAPADIDCLNNSVVLDASGSSSGAEYTYSWTTSTGNIVSGETTLTPTVDAAGVYDLEIFNTTNACIGTASITVSENVSLPTADAGAGGAIDCVNNVLTLVGTGSQGPSYTYLWTTVDGNITSDPTALEIDVDEAGVYVLEVLDAANGCTISSSTEVVGNFDLPAADAGTTASIDCVNSSVVLDGAGSETGTDISYLWTTVDGNIVSGETTLTPEVDAAGTYSLTVMNSANGCSSTANVDVTSDADLPTADAGATASIDCNNSSVVLDGAGSETGTDISYLWTTVDGNIVSGETTLTPEVDAAGTYSLTVTNSANGCSSTADVDVTLDANLPTADAGAPGTIDCVNSSVVLDGSGSETGTGISYLWTTVEGNIVSGETTLTPEVDAEGTYSLTVINSANGCSSTVNVDVTIDIDLPTADAGAGGELNCNVNSVTLVANSSAGSNMQYQWTDATGAVISTELDVEVSDAGVYTFTATNLSNGCSNQSNTEVIENFDLPVSDAGPSMEFICSTNSLVLDGSNSDQGPDISYVWSTSDGEILDGATTLNPEVGAPGTYVLTTLNGGNGCESTDVVVVEDNTTLPVITSTLVGQLDCDNSVMSIDASESTADGELVFLWTTVDGQINSGANESVVEIATEGTYTLTLLNTTNNCEVSENFVIEGAPQVGIDVTEIQSPLCHDSNDGLATVNGLGGDGDFEYLWPDGSTEATNANLGAGVYTVLVTDGNNCTAEVEVEITAPEELILVGIATDETSSDANDGTVEVLVSGGSGTYTYEWSNGETGSEISGLEPGEYTVVVTDENGCKQEVSLNVNAFGCSVSADIIGTDISCFGMNDGSATVDFEGGDILSIEWSNGATGSVVENLEPGLYTVLVTDVDNCPAEASIEIVEPTAIMTEVIDSGGLLCSGDEDGYIVVEGFGGTGELSPEWSTGSTEWGIYDLSAGQEYSLIVTDENGCSETMIITTNEPTAIITSESVEDVSCFGLNDGSILASVTGGTSPYIYEWSTGGNTETIVGLEAGVYSLDITDANGCVITNEYTVAEPTELAVELVEIQASSDSDPTGSVSVNTAGGVEPYTFAWYLDNELVSTEEDLENVGPGSYELTVIDANGCENNSGPHVVEVGVSVDELMYNFSMDVYPNPSNGLFYLEISDLKSSDKMQIELLDLTGKKLSQTVLSGSTDYTEKLDLTTEASGVYFLKVVLSDQVKLIRLINK